MVTLGMISEKKKHGLSPAAILRIIQIAFGLGVVGLLVGGFFVVNHYIALQKKADMLRQTAIYADAKIGLTQSQFIKELEQNATIDDVIKMYGDIQNQQNITSIYYDSLQNPYTYFLEYFLLPPLNIWQDRYTGKIKENMIGQKYLQENNYLDVNLISQWTDFFKNIGNDSPKNEIKSISIDPINEKDGGIFSMNIEVNFVAQTKRSFLLLIDKLSMTSNRQNISLVNEFFFHLWAIMKEKANGGQVTNYAASTADDTTGQGMDQATILATGVGMATDDDLGKNMYAWVGDESNTYITDDDIITAIKRTAACENDDMSLCYFKFREKMRSIPSLAYTVGLPTSNKVKELRIFLKNLPPMINVKTFTFQKQSLASATQGGTRGYEGRLQIEVYGKSMTADDVAQIANELGAKCTNGVPLSPQVALGQLDQTIKQATSVSQISNEKSKQLTDLRTAFNNIESSYEALPGFKKATKLFEIYRMLSENRLCIQK